MSTPYGGTDGNLIVMCLYCLKMRERGEAASAYERYDILCICFTGLKEIQRNKIKILLRLERRCAIIESVPVGKTSEGFGTGFIVRF